MGTGLSGTEPRAFVPWKWLAYVVGVMLVLSFEVTSFRVFEGQKH